MFTVGPSPTCYKTTYRLKDWTRSRKRYTFIIVQIRASEKKRRVSQRQLMDWIVPRNAAGIATGNFFVAIIIIAK